MSRYILDIEANGLLIPATRIWCIVAKDIDTNEVHTFGPDAIQQGLQLIKEAKVLIGHNLTLYDMPLLQKLHGVKWMKKTIHDTLIWSRLLQPDRLGGHSLGKWGVELGFPKGEFTDFTRWDPSMLEYCTQDVQVSHKLYDHLLEKISNYPEAIHIETAFAKIISQQILSGFPLDVEYCNKLTTKLREEFDDLYEQAKEKMDPVKITAARDAALKEGRLIEETQGSYTYSTLKTGIIKRADFKYKCPNPLSRSQISNYFISKYGWVPKQKTDKGSPKIDEKVLSGLEYPEARIFSRLFRLGKQIAMIDGPNGWLTYEVNGRVHGNVNTNGAITGRCRHSSPNLAQIDAKDPRMRKCWVAKPGWVLLSSDADQLEARLLSHYTHMYDNGALKQSLLEGDLHTENQHSCEFESRKSAKTALYAYIYGAGDFKLGTIAKTDKTYRSTNLRLNKLGELIRDRLNKSMTGMADLSKMVRLALASRRHLFGMDHRPLFIRSDHAAINTLVQASGALVMKLCLVKWWDEVLSKGYVYGRDFELCANVHDEVVLQCRPEISDQLGKLFTTEMNRVIIQYNIKCPVPMSYETGNNWSEIH